MNWKTTSRHSPRLRRTRSVLLGVGLLLGASGCEFLRSIFGGGRVTRADFEAIFRAVRYDVPPDAAVVPTLEQLGRLASVTFEWQPEWREVVDELDPRYPALRGYDGAELLTLLPQILPPQTVFEFDFLPQRRIRVRLRYLVDDA